MMRRAAAGIDEMLADARLGLRRVTPREAAGEVEQGNAVLVDIRPQAQRAAEGEVHAEYRPLVVERNVLEWRFDPRSEARLALAAYDLRVIVLCQEGYTSSLAASALQQLGITGATDVVGGFAAWRAAGLPVAPAPGPFAQARLRRTIRRVARAARSAAATPTAATRSVRRLPSSEWVAE
jgi:rhodanese-related sulfurtransferase